MGGLIFILAGIFILYGKKAPNTDQSPSASVPAGSQAAPAASSSGQQQTGAQADPVTTDANTGLNNSATTPAPGATDAPSNAFSGGFIP